MDFALTEDQEMLKKSARDFLAAKCPKAYVKQMEKDEKGYSPALWQEMAALGWQGLAIPERYGGSGLKLVDLAVLQEEMGRACLPGPFFSTVVLGALTLLDAGSPEQKGLYLPQIASGKTLFTLALTETEGLYEPESIAVKAKLDKESYVINGVKLFVPDAHIADYIICVARTSSPADKTKGITLFIVPVKTPGVTVNVLKTISGDKQCEVVFDGVRVTKESILGTVGAGWEFARRSVDRAAILQGCDTVGVLQRVMEMTLDYVKDRKQFERIIGSFQVIQHYMADMAQDVDATRFVVYEAAWRSSKGFTYQ
ncbi:MAG: acyl-CoA/acyl-ACP dehydrogenase, partial [Dehalococcoidales bacterium]|nr:acyl-CoA/acyl-ACP dehydrogenase [Dehalococcoidales bacterium]